MRVECLGGVLTFDVFAEEGFRGLFGCIGRYCTTLSGSYRVDVRDCYVKSITLWVELL